MKTGRNTSAGKRCLLAFLPVFVRGAIGRASPGRCAARCVSVSVRSESLCLRVSVAKLVDTIAA